MEERLGIAGSGAIACGLARLAAQSLDTVVWARGDESAERVRAAVDGGAEVVTEIDRLAERTIVVEAVIEDLAVKSSLLERIGGLLAPEALIATTTSSLSLAELAAASGRSERFAALHVFNPVERMELVELAFHGKVAAATRARLERLCELLGKTVVEVPAAPGFVVNRLLFPYLFEAVRLLEADRLRPEDIDACMRLGAGHPMGPLALLDFVGLDVAAAIGDAIGADVPERVRALVAAGQLGRKAGRGFYAYD
jgi:3-hydroxybutyryl-CoA dehydrogenase